MAFGAQGAADAARYSRMFSMSIASERTFLHFEDVELAEAKQQLRRTLSCPALSSSELRDHEVSKMTIQELTAVTANSTREEDAAPSAVKFASTSTQMTAATPKEDDHASSATMSDSETTEVMTPTRGTPAEEEVIASTATTPGPETMDIMALAAAALLGESAKWQRPMTTRQPSLGVAVSAAADGWQACFREVPAMEIVGEPAASPFHCAPSSACRTQDVGAGLFPSVGSALHGAGCKPCIFFSHGICDMATECQYCHFSDHMLEGKVARPPKSVRNRLKEAGISMTLLKKLHAGR